MAASTTGTISQGFGQDGDAPARPQVGVTTTSRARCRESNPRRDHNLTCQGYELVGAWHRIDVEATE